MTTLHITVGDRNRLREESLQFVRDTESDDTEPEDWAVLQFGSYADLVENLTPLRLDLLRTIVAEGPESIRETARLVERDVSDVHADLKRLELLGALDFEEGGSGGAMRPVVPFDRIEFDVALPLVDRDGGEDHVEA